MLARIQQVIVFTLVVLLTGGFVAALRFDRPAYAALVPAASILGYIVALGVEFALLVRSYERADPLRPRARQMLSAWIGESIAAPCAFLWRQPFLSHRSPDSLVPSPTTRRGVLLVHGFFCNRGLWNPWLERLRMEEIPFIALSLEPVFGPIDSYRGRIEEAVRQLRQRELFQQMVAQGRGTGRQLRIFRLFAVVAPGGR